MKRSSHGLIAILFALALAGIAPLRAASQALVVTGLSGSAADAEEFSRLAGETKRLLAERGMPLGQIAVLSEKVTRETMLEKLKAAAGGAAEDEFWLVLFGYGGRGQGGSPIFQVRGPRLTAEDLQAALEAIPARQFVFLGMSDGGAFLPLLQNQRRTALSATKEHGETDWPRFPGAWVAAFSENPKASLARIAARAAAIVEEEYKTSSLAQGEHARLADPVTGTILPPPFGVNLDAEKETAPGPESSGPLAGASDIHVEIKKPAAEWEQQPATAETKKIVAEARATPNPESHAALVLEQKIGFTVEEDRTTDRLTSWRVFIARDEAVGEWANQFFAQSPPALTTKLELARVIQPDGSATVFNPAKLLAATDPEGGASASAMVFLPGAKAGCVIEMSFRTREILNATLPHVSETIPLLRAAPALRTTLEIRVPEKPAHRVILRNVTATAQETSERGRHIFRWQLGALPAAEGLPGDPPWQEWMACAEISSLPSWEEFAQWYRRLAKGADEIDGAVRKMAAQLSDGAKSRAETMRRDFEFVSALRYVAIEIGVQGFRPRKPAEVLANSFGDCKDKANLLVALLKCQGIGADFVLLNRGGVTDIEFPSWQFNHAIAFVGKAPGLGQPDDLWLDATDSVTPFGFVPPGDHGRAGLVFGKEKTEFKTVTNGAAAASEIRDEWTLDEDAQGAWRGSFHRTASGTADDGLRRVFRELTPMQRGVQIYRMLAELWPRGDFAKPTISDVSALGRSVEIRAEVTASTGSVLPRITTPGLEIFSAPERSRALWLNDGQPVTLTQTVRLHYANSAPEKLPPPRQTEAAGEQWSVVFTRGADGSVTRTANLKLLRPIVPSADYAALRRALRAWNAALAE